MRRQSPASCTEAGTGPMADRDKPGVDAALIERWALAYLERFPSSAANLRGVLLRRIGRRNPADRDAVIAAAPLVDALIARYRETGVVDDAAYAAARARSRLRRGQSLRTIRVGLAAKGVDAAAAATALAGLEGEGDPDLAPAPRARAVPPEPGGTGGRTGAGRLCPRGIWPRGRRGGAGLRRSRRRQP